jgi:Family of unknown function (DUF6152)
MKALLVAIVAGAIVVAARPIAAHHSFAAEFDINQPITLTGKLTKIEFVNPHGWIYLDVSEPDGKVVNWAVEAGGANQLLLRGLRRTDFPVGSEIVVEGYRAKGGTPRANGRTVKFADGRNFFLGASETPGAPK